MKRLFFLLACTLTLSAQAVEYRTVETATVLYDAPSQRGIKQFVIRRDTPVEVVVSLEGWAKVRDSEGTLAWIERKFLAERRSLIVTASRAEKNVSLDYLEAAPGGWIKVRHRDGQSGYVRANQVWGI